MVLRVTTVPFLLFLLSFLNIWANAKSTLNVKQVVVKIPPIPCGGPCGPHEVCDLTLNKCVCDDKHVNSPKTGECLPKRHYGEECMVDEQCVDPRQICNNTCDCFPRTVYNDTEEACVLPCWFTYDTSAYSGRQYMTVGDDVEVEYGVAEAACRAEGGYLPAIIKYQDEVDYAYYKYESGQRVNNENWLGLVQLSRYVYRWSDVDVILEVGSVSADAIYGGYANFLDTEASDLVATDDDDCIFDDGFDDGFGWDDKTCGPTGSGKGYICECPSPEKFEEVFIKGNKDYLF